MPSITQLGYLIAVARTRHFGRAAAECRVSQPALSAQIRKLEEDLDVTVFDRNKKPIMVTDAGAQIIELAKNVVREHERLLHFCESQGDELAGTFSVAIIPTVAPYLLPLFLDKFARMYPKVSLRIREMETAEVVSALLEDRLDAGIAATPLHVKQLRTRRLYYEPFQAYMSKKHPLLAHARVRESMLERDDLWLLEDGHCLRDQVVRACSEGRGSSAYDNVHFEAGSLETLRRVVREGRGYTLVPELFVRQLPTAERKRHTRPMSRPVPTREISLLYRRDHLRPEVQRALAACIQENLPDGVFTSRRAALNVLDPIPS